VDWTALRASLVQIRMCWSELITADHQQLADWMTGPDRLRVSVARRRAFVGDREIALTKTTFDVLALLMRRQGAVVTTDELVREVWGYPDAQRPGFARTAVYRLRRELAAAGADALISSVRGVGFQIASTEPDQPDPARFDIGEALASSATGILVISAGQKVIWANAAAERLSGYSIEELPALPSTSVFSGGVAPEAYAQVKMSVAAGQTLSGPTKFPRRDGTVLELSASLRPVFDSDGEIEYTVLELWDEGATVLSESALQ